MFLYELINSKSILSIGPLSRIHVMHAYIPVHFCYTSRIFDFILLVLVITEDRKPVILIIFDKQS